MDEELYKNIGFRLRCLRCMRGINQETFAQMAGLDRTYVSAVERGLRNFSLATAIKFARALDVPISDLFYKVETEDYVEYYHVEVEPEYEKLIKSRKKQADVIQRQLNNW